MPGPRRLSSGVPSAQRAMAAKGLINARPQVPAFGSDTHATAHPSSVGGGVFLDFFEFQATGAFQMVGASVFRILVTDDQVSMSAEPTSPVHDRLPFGRVRIDECRTQRYHPDQKPGRLWNLPPAGQETQVGSEFVVVPVAVFYG